MKTPLTESRQPWCVGSRACGARLERTSLYGLSKEMFVPYLLEQHGRTWKDPHSAFVRLIASPYNRDHDQ